MLPTQAVVTTSRLTQVARPPDRIAGFFYLLTIFTAPLAMFVRARLIVSGNASVTAANILAHEPLFRLGLAAEILATASYIVVAALFYKLFRPVNSTVSLLAAFFGLTGCAVGASSCLFLVAPLTVLGDARYLDVFKLEQLQALALLFLAWHDRAVNIGIVFFGFYCLLIGYLILKSTFLPRVLSVAMAVAGLGWLTFLYVPLAESLLPYNQLSGLGEVILTLWLLIMGVNVQRWEEQARASAS